MASIPIYFLLFHTYSYTRALRELFAILHHNNYIRILILLKVRASMQLFTGLARLNIWILILVLYLLA